MKRFLNGIIIFVLCLILTGCGCSKQTVRVSFNTVGGSKVETQIVDKGDTLVKPKDPVKEGYTFSGWYIENEKYDFSTEVTEDLELIAKWVKENAILYTIKFNTDGGNTIESIQVEKNTAIGKLPTPTREKYKFTGWYFGNELVEEATVVTNNLTLVAKWEREISTTKTTSKKTTKKTTKTTTRTTTKAQTTTSVTTTTTKKPTTTQKNDELSYKLESNGSVVGQVMLYLTKNGEKVSGTCDIVTTTGETIRNVSINKTGYVTNDGLIETIKNIKVN